MHEEAPSQSGATGIVYELDTLRHRVRRRLERLSLGLQGVYVATGHVATTEQCQVAARPIWDGARKPWGRDGVVSQAH